MKYIYLLTIILVTFTSGVLIAKNHYELEPEELQQEFKLYGQFHPDFINYGDSDMLVLCDKYNLVYNYEDGECI